MSSYGTYAAAVLILGSGLGLMACGAAEPESNTLPAPPLTATADEATPTSPPSATPPPTQTALPATPTPYLSPTPTPFTAPGDTPAFSPVIFFTTDPTRPTAQRGFPFGVEEVFAQWEYRNMREGVAVRREWIRDQEEIWLVREENWDFARYGADGTIADVSVFDREGGLDPGRYTLRLYIDGVAQFAGGDNWAEDSSFVILDPNKRAGAYPSPGAEDSQVAILEAPGTLLLRACAGCPEEALITTPEIREIVWFPDNQHILYTIVDRSEQIYAPATIGIRFELWIVDVLSGEKEQLRGGTPWAPAVAPDGRTIAVMEGSGWCDAGECDLTLVFLQLDENLQPSASIGLDAFTFDPANSFGWDMFPVDQPDLPAPGAWESATVFRSGLYQTLDATFQGIYLFDLSTLVARRVGELAPLDSMDAPG